MTVVTGFPHYPGNSLYPGYSLAPLRKETRDGIPIVRAFEWPYHGESVVGRALNYGTFMLAAPFAALAAPEADVLYVWHPPLTVGIAAWLIARWRGIPFVYDVQDIWPDSVESSGLLSSPWILRFLRALERFVYARAAHIIVKTDGARANLVSKGVEPTRVSILSDWVDDAELVLPPSGMREETRRALGWGSEFVVLFAGNLGVLQKLDTLINAAKSLSGERIRIVLAGDGSDRVRLESLTRSLNVGDVVTFIGKRGREEMPAIMCAADALAITLSKSPIADFVIPSKTSSCLAAGRPILSATGGAADRLVQSVGAGLAVPPEDPLALAGAIRVLRDMPKEARETMGRKGREYASGNLRRGLIVEQHAAIFGRAVRDAVR